MDVVTVKTVKAGLEYRVKVNGKSVLLMRDDADIVWLTTPTSNLGGFSLERFGGELNPASIRFFFSQVKT